MALDTRAHPPSPHEYDPLSQPLAAFYGHAGNNSPLGRPIAGSLQAESSKDAQAREAEATLREKARANGWEQVSNGEDDEDEVPPPRSEALRIEQSSPRINPFHLLSHPSSDATLPPLPTHLQALASDTGDPAVESHQFAQQLHVVAQQTTEGYPPLHITKVTPSIVQVKTGPAPSDPRSRRIMNKVSNVFRKESNGDLVKTDGMAETISDAEPSKMLRMQDPPPSPPISEAEVVETEIGDGESSVIVTESVESATDPATQMNGGAPLPPVTEATEVTSPSLFTSNLTTEPSDMANASPIKAQPGSSPARLAVPSARRVSSSSTSSRTGSLAVVRSGRYAQNRDTGSKRQDAAGLGLGKDLPRLPDGEITLAPRMHRRSTNPSPIVTAPARSPLLHANSTFATTSPRLRSQTTVPGLEGPALDSDIIAQAETIRRERLERRQKKASAASTTEPTEEVKEKPKVEPKREDTRVLVGNLIGEDHVNFVLMYNMLTGIRIGVSRCQAKIKRPLTDEDYVARHKFSFDIVGNELTPSARYDFKFKDYAPWVFRDLRDEHFHLDPADYLLSLTAKYILSELGSPGKSGSFFYFSRDYRFIIKTISHSEHKFLRSILKDYHEHVKNNPHTLLSRFYGLHRVKLPRGRKIHFVIMNNLFPPHRDIHETYDLKGSAFGREYPEDKAKSNPKAVLKDKNWVNRGRTLELGPEKRALLSEQLRRDMEFLKRMRVMDYSLLVGIHNMERGNRDNLRENQLTVFHPEMPTPRRKPSAVKASTEASNVRKAIRRSDPKTLDVASQLPQADSSDRRHFLFYQDEGGLRATDEANQNMDVIYYLGVIDICTPYNTAKKIEHFWKSMTEDRMTISCVEPVSYGQRFLNFLLSVMRGGDQSLRPLGLQPDNPLAPEKEVGQDTAPMDTANEGEGQAAIGHSRAE